MIFADFARALAQSVDPRFLRVLLKALALTVALLVGIWFGAGWLVSLLPDWSFTLPWLGEISLGAPLAGLGLAAVVLASAFLMFPVAAVFIGIFLDEIVEAVEARHYPHLPPVRPLSIMETLADALGFFALMLVANLVGLVFYLFSGPLAPFVFWLVNGFLLGREYFQMIALRRLTPEQAKALRRRNLIPIWTAGVLMAIPLSVPVLNLVIPILGVATFTHLFHRLERASA